MRDFAVAAAPIRILKIYPVFVLVQHHQGLIFAGMCEQKCERRTKKPGNKKIEKKKSKKRKRKKNRTKVQQILDAGIKKIKIEKKE